jgi:hypothetical protein
MFKMFLHDPIEYLQVMVEREVRSQSVNLIPNP